jgi:hypothetical protein
MSPRFTIAALPVMIMSLTSPASAQSRPAGTPPAELRVVGNRIHAADGSEIWLQGVNVASLEWSAGGENVLKSIGVAIDDWRANVIRLPVAEKFWFGRGEGQTDRGAAYRGLVDQCIQAASSRGAYTIVDLHEYKAPRQTHIQFWTDVADRYKGSPAVLFGLLNEPHSISWDIWRDGGTVEERRPAANGVIAENQQATETFKSPGFQAVIDAVRKTGARNIVVVAGLDWGYDLSGVVNGFALDDRGGNGIVYDSHIYPWKSDWAGKVLVAAAKHPVLVGEVGAPLKRFDFIPPERHEDPYTWVPDMLGFIQQNKLHWTAWCFHTSAAPVMISDWNYTPTPYWGAFAKQALRGKSFDLVRMR